MTSMYGKGLLFGGNWLLATFCHIHLDIHYFFHAVFGNLLSSHEDDDDHRLNLRSINALDTLMYNTTT